MFGRERIFQEKVSGVGGTELKRGINRMSLLLKIVDSWAVRFDDSKYPRDFYLQMLASISTAPESGEMGQSVIRMLQWKDGKVRLDPNGNTTINGLRYAIGRTKPNTYNPKVHDPVLLSNHFFGWAQEVKKRRDFSPDLLEQISRLGLYNSLVIPVFLLHILNPRIFPIFDQHVERARRFLMGGGLNTGLTVDDYAQYTQFWSELLSDIGVKIATAEYARIKHIDEALWAMGKHLLKGKRPVNPTSPRPPEPADFKEDFNATVSSGRFTTSSPEFKNAVFKYCGSMTQSAAMKHAAKEFGIALPRSYLIYPGSHINRWRRQGFPK
jgi:hypothetical protein